MRILQVIMIIITTRLPNRRADNELGSKACNDCTTYLSRLLHEYVKDHTVSYIFHFYNIIRGLPMPSHWVFGHMHADHCHIAMTWFSGQGEPEDLPQVKHKERED